MDPETLPEDIPFRDDLLIGFSKPLSLNFPMQGSASEVMALALVNTHRALKGSSAKLLASVHDELVLECPTPLVDEIKHLVADTMTCGLHPIVPGSAYRRAGRRGLRPQLGRVGVKRS